MNRGRSWSGGYTIVETMIFLAVSAAMFTSVMVMISGRQARQEFSGAVRDFQSQIETIGNQVSTGYYKNLGNFTCTKPGSKIQIRSGGDRQGQNQDCIFIGRAIQFGVGGDKEVYNIYNLVGARQYADSASGEDFEVQNLTQATPVVMVGLPGSTPYGVATNNIPDAIDQQKFGGGVTVERVEYATAATTPYGSGGSIGLAAITTTFRNYDSNSLLTSGSRNTDLIVPTTANTVGMTQNSAAGIFNGMSDTSVAGNPAPNVSINPAGGVRVCLQSNGSKQYAWVTILSSAAGVTTDANFLNGGCP